MNQMTTQETFDTVFRHLVKQGRRSMTTQASYGENRDTERCSYRGKGGTSCAIGCLIPDELYSPDIEGKSFNIFISLSDRDAHLKGVTAPITEYLLQVHPGLFYHAPKWEYERILGKRLQCLHDGCDLNLDGSFDVVKLQSRLEEVAKNFDLNVDAIVEYFSCKSSEVGI